MPSGFHERMLGGAICTTGRTFPSRHGVRDDEVPPGDEWFCLATGEMCMRLVLPAFLALLTLSPGPARAEWFPRIEIRSQLVLINREPVAGFRTFAGGLAPAERAAVFAGRLQAALRQNGSGVQVRAASKNEAMLFLAGRPLTTVTRADAEGSDPLPLARRWANQLEAALRKPGLILSARTLTLPVNETRTIRIGGVAQGAVQVRAEGEAGSGCDLQVIGSPGKEQLTVRGTRLGSARLTIQREGAQVTLDVQVLPYAAELQAAAPIDVASAIPSQALLRRLVLNHVLSAVSLLEGAQLQVSEPELPQGGILSANQIVSIGIRASGPRMLPIETKVPVLLRMAQPVVQKSPSVLFYSNWPERIERPGPLFAAALPQGDQPVRLLYHHQSALKEGVAFQVELINTGNENALVGLLWSQAGPVRDTVWGGFCAGRDFLQAQRSGAQVRTEIPPHTRLVLSQETLRPGLTISGLCELQQLSGQALQVRIRTLPADGAPKEILSPLESSVSETEGEPSADTYPGTPIRRQETFTIGGPWRFLDLGKNAPASLTERERRLHGDYGLTYEVEVELINPTAQEKSGRFVFDAAAGLAAGAFFIDDEPVLIPQTDHQREVTLRKFALPANSRRKVRIETVPLSGSNYPARLIVRDE
ncbi:MAG: hypothetical protein QM758_22540 [Armatimonas sp.]